MAYTKQAMRERIKNRIKAGSKGGKPGQWSARKAQLLSQAYEKAGGGYSGPKTKAQQLKPGLKKAFWDTKNPSKKSKKLTPAQKAAAKKRAKAAGRPYPNLVDNAAVSRKKK
jgi:hypothetical protein